MDFFRTLIGFVVRPSNSRTLGILVVLILVSSIFLTITATQQQQTTEQLAANKPIMGDVNSDNILDMKDYNAIVNCFGAKKDSSVCADKNTADLNKDGIVNENDLNIFLTNLTSLTRY